MVQSKKKEIFRKAALERLSSPEELDQLMQVTTPKGWLALLGLVSLIVVALIWGIFGNIPTKVSGQGILLNAGGVTQVSPLTTGRIQGIYVNTGDVIPKGKTIARISNDNGERERVVSPQAGRVLEIRATEGSVVSAGSPIISLSLSEQGIASLEAVIYVPVADGQKIRPNMPVELTPATVNRQEAGYIPGRVISVSEFPVTREGMLRTLGSDTLVQKFAANDAVIEVQVLLQGDPASSSGYRWSSKEPNVVIDTGTLSTAQIITQQRRPIGMVIPLLKETVSGPLFEE